MALLSAILLATRPAAAEERHVVLTYEVEPGAQGCPDEKWVRQAVSARLGYDPFHSGAGAKIEARIRNADKGLAATLEVTTPEGKPAGRRQFTSTTGDCLELVSAMELAIAIAVDPQYLSRPVPVDQPTPTPAQPSPVPPATPAPVAAPSTPLEFQARLGAFGSAGLGPTIVPGLSLQLAVRWPRFSIGLDGRADLADSIGVGTGRVWTSTLLGCVVPCFHVSRFGICGVLSAGAMQVTGEIGPTRRETSPLVLAGARFKADIALSSLISLQPFIDVQAVLTRVTVLSGSTPVWVTPPVAGATGLAIAFHFL